MTNIALSFDRMAARAIRKRPLGRLGIAATLAAILLGATARVMSDVVRYIEIISYSLITLLGLRLLWVKGSAAIASFRELQAEHEHEQPAGHRAPWQVERSGRCAWPALVAASREEQPDDDAQQGRHR